jgi:hypothetical protein
MPPFPQNAKRLFWFTEMAILRLKKYFSSIATYCLSLQFLINELHLNYFPLSKMAISEYQNGHFEEIRAWLQILE